MKQKLKDAVYILLGIGIVWFFASFQSGIAAMRPRVDLYGADTCIEDIGFFDMVDADIEVALDSFAVESSGELGTSKKVYYIIPVMGRDGETYFIAVEVAEDRSVPYDKVVKSTWERIEGKSNAESYKVHATGCIKKLNAKKYNFLQKWFEEAEIFETKEELNKYVLPLYLSNESAEFCATSVMIGAACILISVLLVGFRIGAQRKRKQEVKQLMRERAERQKYITIDGKDYPKAVFDHVNELCRKSKRKQAMQELCDITGIEVLYAKIIIDNWNEYYYA